MRLENPAAGHLGPRSAFSCLQLYTRFILQSHLLKKFPSDLAVNLLLISLFLHCCFLTAPNVTPGQFLALNPKRAYPLGESAPLACAGILSLGEVQDNNDENYIVALSLKQSTFLVSLSNDYNSQGVFLSLPSSIK